MSKMPKEYVLVLIVGLFLLAYLLEAIVDPLALPIATPYQFLSSEYISQVPFSTAVIFIRSLAIFITPLWLLSFVDKAFQFKGITLLIVAILLQLYGVQATASSTVGIPLEWAISFALGGASLFIPMLIFFLKGSIGTRPSSSPKDIGNLADDDDDDL